MTQQYTWLNSRIAIVFLGRPIAVSMIRNLLKGQGSFFGLSLRFSYWPNARDERIAERRQRQSEGTDALWARGLLRKTRDQHRRSAQSHSWAFIELFASCEYTLQLHLRDFAKISQLRPSEGIGSYCYQ